MPKYSLQECARPLRRGDGGTVLARGLAILLAMFLVWAPIKAWYCSMLLCGAGGGGSASVAFSLTYGASAGVAGGTATVDYGTLSFGSGCTRVIVAAIWQPGASQTISSIASIGGISFTQVSGAYVQGSATTVASDIWESNGAIAGSSGDVSITYSSAITGFGTAAAVYCLNTNTPAASSAVHNSNINSMSVSQNITVPSGGGALAISAEANGHTITFTNATTDATAIAPPFSDPYYFAHTTSTGTMSVTATTTASTGVVLVLSLAAWGP